MVLSTHRWRELDSNHRSRRERDGRRQRPAALAGHLIKDLSPDRTVLSLSHGRLVIGANCNYALPRQLLLFVTSKFGFVGLGSQRAPLVIGASGPFTARAVGM